MPERIHTPMNSSSISGRDSDEFATKETEFGRRRGKYKVGFRRPAVNGSGVNILILEAISVFCYVLRALPCVVLFLSNYNSKSLLITSS
jgi:hypothetical protein